MPDDTTAITIHVNDVLLGIIDARAAANQTTRDRLVFSDLLMANMIGSRHLHKALLAKRGEVAND
jgi:hypothetical protein